MEEIRRENLLFESYILRNEKEFAGKKEDTEQQKRYRRKGDKLDQFQEVKLLSSEMKYEIANAESEALKKNIDEGRIKSDSILETLRVSHPLLCV